MESAHTFFRLKEKPSLNRTDMCNMVGGEYALKISALKLLQFGSEDVLKSLKKRVTQVMNESGNQR